MDKIPLERKITDTIMRYLKGAGYWAVKIHGAAYQTAGLPDIVAIDKKGRFVGLEVKRPKVGRVTELQRRTLENINIGGGYAVVVRSVCEAAEAMLDSEAGRVAFYIEPELYIKPERGEGHEQ